MVDDKSLAVPEEKDIDLIRGNTNILLIAPHGVESKPMDDIGTAELTRQIRAHLGCTAIINPAFRKPEGKKPEKRNNGIPSFEAKVLNLNILDQVRQHPRFRELIKKVVNNEGLTYVFWIHGISDSNIQDGYDCYLGCGQPNTEEKEESRYTAEKETIDKTINQLSKSGIRTIRAPKTSKYRGWKKTYMNQWLNLEGYKFTQAQSIQLEFKKTGIRGEDDIKSASKKIAMAISTLSEESTDAEVVDEDLEPEAQIVENATPEKSVALPAVEMGEIIDNAYEHLKGIFKKHFQNAMLDAGKYLVEQFYGGDYGKAREKKFTKNKSLAKLIKKIQQDAQKKGDAPSRSWVYEAVNLAADNDLFEQGKLPSVYRHLGHSHKVNLTNAPNDEVKRLLIEETADKNHTVSELRNRIREEKFKLDSNYIPVRETMSILRLRKIDVDVLGDLKTQTHKLTTDTRRHLGVYQGNLEKIDKMIAEKGSLQEIISVSRRTDIPAHYSDWFFNRIKDGFLHVRKKINPKSEIPGDVLKVSLKPENVRCFVFWTKNPGPMLDRLDELEDYDNRYYFQFTLTPYGPDIEKALPPKEELEETFIKLSEKVGPDRVIWRYDPILLTDTIDINYHKEHFERLSEKFHGYTKRCVISFIDYKQMSPLSKREFTVNEIDKNAGEMYPSVMQKIAGELVEINKKFGFEIQTCGEAIDLSQFGISHSKCVDDVLITNITGKHCPYQKDKSQRPDCFCTRSIDIGTDNTCAYGCLFCYATKQHERALEYHKNHNVDLPLWVGNTDKGNIKKMILKSKPNSTKLLKSIENNEWTLSKNDVNFSTGCSNACLYCCGPYTPFAKRLAEEAKSQGKVFNWGEPTIRQDDIDKPQFLRDGRIGFPTSHDITPGNLDNYLTVLGKLLKAGNRVLIITKPRLDCIKAICEASVFFKDEILFRFTITAKSDEILKFWEPNAPSYEHRIECLKYAYDAGFQTSVSIEPMLEYSKAEEMVDEMIPFVTDAIWFGKMSCEGALKNPKGKLKEEFKNVEDGYSKASIKALHSKLEKKKPKIISKIKWKLAFKEHLGIPLPPAPGMDI